MNALALLLKLKGTTQKPCPLANEFIKLPDSSPDMSALACDQFGLNSKTGFLPPQVPLARLPSLFSQWEDALQHAMVVLKRPGDSDDPLLTEEEKTHGLKWRQGIQGLEVLSVDCIKSDIRASQRAHHVLAFLVQFYVQSLPPCAETDGGPIHIPPGLSIPFVDISRHLDIAPILTYADCVLWNFYLEDPSKPLTVDNIRIRDMFTKNSQEEHFFLTSARIEVRGFEAIQLMGDIITTIKNAESNSLVDEDRLQKMLSRLATVIDDLNEILWAVRDGCGYQFFYWVFRPWIRGTDQGSGSPKWFYEGVDGEGIEFQCSGPSAGQAALMHAFDVFLGISHPQKDDRYSPTCTGMRVHPSYDPHAPPAPCPAASATSLPVKSCPVFRKFPLIINTGMSEELRPFLFEAPYPSPPAEKIEMVGAHLPESPLPLVYSPSLLTPPHSPPSSPLLRPSCPGEVPKLGLQPELDTSFIVRMRKYIPGRHQEFLLHLARSNVRSHIASCDSSAVRLAYNACVWAIKRFRDTHIKIVTLYVIHPARSKVLIKDADVDSAPVRGTGGTSLVPLLKAYRDNTISTVLETC